MHGDQGLFDTLGVSRGPVTLDNLSIIHGAWQNTGDDVYAGAYSQIGHLLKVRVQILEHKSEIQGRYASKIDSHRHQVNQALKLDHKKEQFENALNGGLDFDIFHPSDSNAEAEAFSNSVNEVVNQIVKDLHEDMNAYEIVAAQKHRIYHHYMSHNESEAMDNFHQGICQHLAGTIVLKEHRNRYQLEQYERFVYSVQNRRLSYKDQTLGDFCKEYAAFIELLIEDSHSGKCPKIEANYDDFAEKTIRPINATIFYYFFSAGRTKKTIAQWLLSAIRYPNEQVKRAYMRFFA